MAGLVHSTQTVDGKLLVTNLGTGRRIIRRGIPYGPLYQPGANPDPAQEAEVERGLLLLAICASLKEQFEFLMTEWINGQTFSSEQLPKDPLLGDSSAEESEYLIKLKKGNAVKLQGFSRFVEVRGGAYGFIPSLSALRYLAQSSS